MNTPYVFCSNHYSTSPVPLVRKKGKGKKRKHEEEEQPTKDLEKLEKDARKRLKEATTAVSLNRVHVGRIQCLKACLNEKEVN